MRHQFSWKPCVGWSQKELVWLEAAMTLPAEEFLYACEDIASMSHRTIDAITAKIKAIRREEEYQAKQAAKRLAARMQIKPLQGPDMKALMSGRASVARHRISPG